MPENFDPLKMKKDCTIIEVVYKVYEENVEKYKYCVVMEDTKSIIFEEIYKGEGANPYLVFRWN